MAGGVIEISPVNKNQFKIAHDWLLEQPETEGIDYSIEWTPANNVEELNQNTMRVAANGEASKLIALRNKIVNRANQLGLTVTVNKATKGLLNEIRDAVEAVGTQNKPALKTAIVQILKENRNIGPQDERELRQYLSQKGFSSIEQLKEWLNA